MKARETITIDGLDELLGTLESFADHKEMIKVAKKSTQRPTLIMMNGIREHAQSMVGGRLGSRIFMALEFYPAPKKWRRGGYAYDVRLSKLYNDEFVHFTKGAAFEVDSKKQVKGSGKRYYIPSAVEYGHRIAGTNRRVAPIPFMRRGFDVKAEGCAWLIKSELSQKIKQLFNKKTRAAIKSLKAGRLGA